MSWKPIETAPKDGTLILVCNFKSKKIAMVHFYQFGKKEIKGVWLQFTSGTPILIQEPLDFEPTGWQDTPVAEEAAQ